eukprot:GHVQ01026662.1.p1 GENE.GHVQ01026662.1~~GHVQ01026662.1.p1  ORF type:complete len:762 (-),score=130.21 GHVQ01026662.1:756-3041(-)
MPFLPASSTRPAVGSTKLSDVQTSTTTSRISKCNGSAELLQRTFSNTSPSLQNLLCNHSLVSNLYLHPFSASTSCNNQTIHCCDESKNKQSSPMSFLSKEHFQQGGSDEGGGWWRRMLTGIVVAAGMKKGRRKNTSNRNHQSVCYVCGMSNTGGSKPMCGRPCKTMVEDSRSTTAGWEGEGGEGVVKKAADNCLVRERETEMHYGDGTGRGGEGLVSQGIQAGADRGCKFGKHAIIEVRGGHLTVHHWNAAELVKHVNKRVRDIENDYTNRQLEEDKESRTHDHSIHQISSCRRSNYQAHQCGVLPNGSTDSSPLHNRSIVLSSLSSSPSTTSLHHDIPLSSSPLSARSASPLSHPYPFRPSSVAYRYERVWGRKISNYSGMLTYRDVRQIFIDHTHLPTVNARRHCIVISLPPVTCLLLHDTVYLSIIAEVVKVDKLIDNLKKLSRIRHLQRGEGQEGAGGGSWEDDGVGREGIRIEGGCKNNNNESKQRKGGRSVDELNMWRDVTVRVEGRGGEDEEETRAGREDMERDSSEDRYEDDKDDEEEDNRPENNEISETRMCEKCPCTSTDLVFANRSMSYGLPLSSLSPSPITASRRGSGGRKDEENGRGKEAGGSPPFEFGALEAVIGAAFEHLSRDLCIVELDFRHVIKKSRQKKITSTVLLDQFHKIKEPIDMLAERVRAFGVVFEDLIDDEEYLKRMELTKYKEFPPLYEQTRQHEPLNADLEILLEYFDQEMDNVTLPLYGVSPYSHRHFIFALSV